MGLWGRALRLDWTSPRRPKPHLNGLCAARTSSREKSNEMKRTFEWLTSDILLSSADLLQSYSLQAALWQFISVCTRY